MENIKKVAVRMTNGDLTNGTSWVDFCKLKKGATKVTLNGTQKDGAKLPTFEHEDLEHVIGMIHTTIRERTTNFGSELNRYIIIESSEKVLHVRFGYGSTSKSPSNYMHEIKLEVE